MQNIKTNSNEGILTITINRPEKMNALNQDVLSELREVITTFYEDENFGAILTGAGDKAFVAGADISEFSGLNKEEGRQLSANGQEIFNLIENCPKPVIAAVNGFALGGGCELAMACHIRVAVEEAKFGQPEVNLGIIPGYGGTQRLTQLIGKAKSLELSMTGDMVSGKEAARLGLANYAVSREELMPKCESLLKKIGQKAPLAIAGVIKCVNHYYSSSHEDGMVFENNTFADCTDTEDFKEGASAFLEKRRANFRGV